MRKFLFLSFFLGLSGCELAEQVKVVSEDQSKNLPELAVELRQEASLLSTCEVSADCSAIGFTPKPCGGYFEHLVISQRSDAEGVLANDAPSPQYLLLSARIISYRDRIKDYNKKNGIVSDCSIREAPRAQCSPENKCVLQEVVNPYAEIDAGS